MSGVLRNRGFRMIGWLVALLFLPVSVQADPIVIGGGSVFTIFAVISAISVEAACMMLLLRRSRTPRRCFLGSMGIHLLTYPIFLGIVWYSEGLRPELILGFGEGMMVLIEGAMIYYLCRLAPSAKAAMPFPSVGQTLLASLMGNICSVAAFPLMTFLNAWIPHIIHGSNMD